MDKFIAIIILLLLLSCSNEVVVNMENEGLPVVYCILNMDDSLQQLRLARSFFPDKGVAGQHLTIGRWDEPVEVYLEEWKDKDRPVTYDFYPSDQIRQDTGLFSNPSFSLFETRLKPVVNTLYYIYLWFPERNYYAYASTMTVEQTEIINPAAIPGRKVTFSDNNDFSVELKPGLNAEFHQFSFILTVEEHTGTGFQQDHFDFGGQAYEENYGQTLIYQLNSDRFFAELLARYDTLSGNDYRNISGVEFDVYSYGMELRLYNRLYQNGIQPWEIQSYSSFKNGIGLFSSKSKSRTTNLELSNLTYDLLTRDARYKHLRFVR